LETGDRAGIAVAIACAIHCVAAPVLAASVQVAALFASERTELLFLSFSLLVSGVTFGASCLRRGTREWRLICGLFGLGSGFLLVTRIGWGWTEPLEQPLVLAGATLIVAAHLFNVSSCRCTEERSCAAID
jgi:MerC mercury resistance protein